MLGKRRSRSSQSNRGPFKKYAGAAGFAGAAYKVNKYINAHGWQGYKDLMRNPQVAKQVLAIMDRASAQSLYQPSAYVSVRRKASRKKRRRGYKANWRSKKRSFRKMGRRGYKRRRGFRSRRRRSNKSNSFYSRRFQKAVQHALAKETASKIWKSEGAVGEQVSVGICNYWIPYTCGSSVDMQAALEDLGEGNQRLEGTDNDATRFSFQQVATACAMKNLSEHDIHVTVYYCICRNDIESSDHAGLKTTALNYLLEGWKDRMLDADETGVAAIAVSGDSVSTKMFSLNPYESSNFVGNFRIAKVTRRVLGPADTMRIDMKKRKRFQIRKHQILQKNEDGLRNISMFPLVKFHGSQGHLDGDITSIGTLAVNLGAMFFKKIKFTYVATHIPLIAITNTKAVAGDFEAPSRHMNTDDDEA